MNKSLIRTYKFHDVNDIKEHLLIHGALSSTCGKCQAINLKLDMLECPQCKTQIKYIAFQNVYQHMPKLLKIAEERTAVTLIDYDDYKKSLGTLTAKKFLE